MSTISVLLADSQYLIRLGLRHLLEGRHEYKIVSEATNKEELLNKISHLQPKVVILDHRQHLEFNQEIFQQIKTIAPSTNVLIISDDSEKENIYNLLESGINSFLTKQCDEEEIINAINATAKGDKFFCGKVLNFLLEKSFVKDESTFSTKSTLTLRQIEIVKLIAQGKIAKEIAAELDLSTHTVYTHRKNIMKKLNINSTSQLVVYAMNQGLLN